MEVKLNGLKNKIKSKIQWIQLQLDIVEERTSKVEDGAAETISNSAETEPWET